MGRAKLAKEPKIYQIYQNLLEKHGHPGKIWPQWCSAKKTSRTREVIALGAILTQRTSWHNAHLALLNLKNANLLSLAAIAALPSPESLTELVRPAGFYRTKPRCLYDLAEFITRNYGTLEQFNTEKWSEMREKLLDIHGIGPETADVILLYALEQTVFVIDEYTRRLAQKESLAKKLDYDFLQKLFESSLPQNVEVFQNFHALIITDQKGRDQSMMERV